MNLLSPLFLAKRSKLDTRGYLASSLQHIFCQHLQFEMLTEHMRTVKLNEMLNFGFYSINSPCILSFTIVPVSI